MNKIFSNSPTPELDAWTKDGFETVLAKKYGLSLVTQNFVNPIGNRVEEYAFCRKTSGVTVVPMLPNGNLIITRTFKQGSNSVVWEFPAGRKSKDTSATDQVIAELSQESGLTSKELVYLGSTHTAPRKFDTYEDLFVAVNCVMGEPKPEPGEILEVYEITPEEFWQLVLSSAGVSGFSELAAWRAAANGYLKKV